MKVRAPGVVKLLGEHAVVYGKLSIAAAISLYATAEVERNSTGLVVDLPDIGIKGSMTRDELAALHRSYKSRTDINEFINSSGNVELELLPYFTVAAQLLGEHSIDPCGTAVIRSEIPIQKGNASSAACLTTFAVAMAKISNSSPDDAELIEAARAGEKIVHKNEGAGKIDISTSYYGGIVSFNGERGARREESAANIDILMIDTGPKRSTAEMVGIVSNLYKTERGRADVLFNRIDRLSATGLDALKANDLGMIGRCMYEDHAILSEMGVSSSGLDVAVELARRHGAYGAKLSGGGGGGLAIAIADDYTELRKELEHNGFESVLARISPTGAKDMVG